jgi:hypothetical protein
VFTKGGKNGWLLLILALAGIVIGGFLATYLGALPYMGWLAYGRNFGLEQPIVLDLGIIKLQFALLIRFTVAGIIGMIIAIIIYRKI